MIPTSRHARRSLWQLQRRNVSAGAAGAATAAEATKRRQEKELRGSNIQDHPEVVERYLQMANRQERGKLGTDFADPFMQDQSLSDLTLATPWIPLWPLQLAPGSTLLARIAVTWNEMVSNMRARREWIQSNTGFGSSLRSAYTMLLLAQVQSFYRPPQYPPWANLPPEALAPELREATTLPPQTPSSIHEASGTFIPLSHYSGQETNTRHRDPHTSVGKPIEVHLFNGKYPISFQLLKWDAARLNWTKPMEADDSKKSKKKKKKVDWIEGFRWSCMETYLKQLHAFSVGDIQSLKLLTIGEYQQQLVPIVRDRFRTNLSASRFDGLKKPGWNVPSVRQDKLTYRWVFHGPYPGGEGNGSGCRIRSIRARESWTSIRAPPVGNAQTVQAVVSFDTIQSLQVYSNDKLVREEEPRRVREDYILEKKMFAPLPWAIRGRLWDSAGLIPTLAAA